MGALDWESLCEQKVWSSEFKMLGFPGIQTTLCQRTRTLRNKMMLESKMWLLDESSNENECPEATCGESSHGNGYTEVTWGETIGSSPLIVPFLQSSTLEVAFFSEPWTESIG